ncbi:Integrase, catalytic core [Gossypium australe]|uniref:Integrase, catalytic core n=1 Tax=Gossypium australe TaxID=47621 RepID=A0A5B6WPH7_9ROSI|nr:Integrase, catalytic core [Gossypium australe]
MEITKHSVVSKISFPTRLKEKKKWDKDEFVSFLNLFKNLNVNFPLSELIKKVPKYAKFIKEIRCRRIKVGKQVNINASYSAIILRQVPQKLKDPGSFTIPIEIGSVHFNRVKLLLIECLYPYFEKIGLGDLKNTQILSASEMSTRRCVSQSAQLYNSGRLRHSRF